MLRTEEAFEIAQKTFDEIHKKYDFNDFCPVELISETNSYWYFFSGSKGMTEPTHDTRVTVDKKDGHIWTQAEIDKYFHRNT